METIDPARRFGGSIDFSVWDEHKETLRRLYLVEGKPLKHVKSEMESCHGFPKFESCIYEVVLREHFQYRKNLDCKQWLLIDRELERQKQHGQSCVVLLCGMALKPNLVMKKVRRARKESTRKQSKQDTLPDFVKIVATEPVKFDKTSPIQHLRPPRSQHRGASSTSGTGVTDPSLTDSTPPPAQSLIETGFERTIGFVDFVSGYDVEQAYNAIQATLPSKQLIRHLRDFVEERLRFLLAAAFQPFYMLTNEKRDPVQGRSRQYNQSYPQPRNIGKNGSIDILETACFKLTNGFDHVNHGCGERSLLEWIGAFADTSLLKEFFSQENAAVAALWWDLVLGPTERTEQYATLIEVGLAVRDGEWLQYEFDVDFFNMALVGEQHCRAERAMDVWVTTTLLRGHYRGAMRASRHRGVRGFTEQEQLWMMRIWIDSRKGLGTESLDLVCDFGHLFFTQDYLQVHIVLCLVELGASGDPDFLWVPPLGQLASNFLLNVPGRRLPRFTWKRMQYLSGLRDPHASPKERSEWLETAVVVWSIYSAAMGGPKSLKQQMQVFFDPGSPAYAFGLQMALSEAVGMEDIEVLRSLLEFGVDPNTTLLPAYEIIDNDTCLVGLPRAAGLLSPEIVAIFIEHGADLIRLRPLALRLAAANLEPLTRSGAGRLWRTMSLLLQLHMQELATDGTYNAALNLEHDTLHLLMRALGRLEGVYGITPPQYRAILVRLFPDNTLRQAVRYSCSLAALGSLRSNGMELDPTCWDQERSRLHDALLARSIDRYAIVKLLLRSGASQAVDSGGMSLLVAALSSTAKPDMSLGTSSIAEWRTEQETSLRLFKDFRKRGAKFPENPLSLLSLLLVHKAPISIFKEVVEDSCRHGQLNSEYSKLVVYSIALGQFGPAQWLIGMGVNVDGNQGQYRNRSALWAACAKKAPGWFIRLLIGKGANVEPFKTSLGRTPLQIAASAGHVATASFLLCNGAMVNTECKTLSGAPLRMTALDWAATMGRLDMVSFLVDCGGQSACKGLTGFDGAFWHARGHLGVLSILERCTGYSFLEVMASLRRKFPDVLVSEGDIMELTRYEDWDTEVDWAWSDWTADDESDRRDAFYQNI